MLLNVRHINSLNRSTLCCLCLRKCQHLRALHSGCVIDLGSDYPVILRTPPIRTMSNCQGALVLHSLKPRRVLFAPNWQIGEGKAGRESSRLAWNGSFSDSSQKLLTVVLAMPANTAYENCLLENRVVSLLENLTSSGWPDHLPLLRVERKFRIRNFWKNRTHASGVTGASRHIYDILSSLWVMSLVLQANGLHFSAAISVNADVSWLRLSAASC